VRQVYKVFDARRKRQEAVEADRADLQALEDLERSVKDRR